VTLTASAPATRVTGSMFRSLMWPCRAMSAWIFSSRSASVIATSGLAVWTEYGSETPAFSCALPCASNSIGRF
jgi:hypothetical protein